MIRARPVPFTVLAVVITLLYLVKAHGLGLGGYRLDLDVYRIGTLSWLHGHPLYGTLPPTRSGARLLFTYPPFALLALSPLALLPYAAANALLTVGSIAATGWTVRLFLLRSGHGLAGRWLWLAPLLLLLEPLRQTLCLGQVNAVLMAVVATDCLRPAGRYGRGFWAGVAAAVKLTPLVFLLFFLIGRDRRGARNLLGGFAISSVAAVLIDPEGSRSYWTRIVFATGRVGPPQYAANQSITGALSRLGAHGAAGIVLWLVLCGVLAALAMRGMARASAAGRTVRALSICAVLGLLVSPISWSHHWVWAVPALVVLLADGLAERRREFTVGAGVGLVLVAVGPQWLLPASGNRELHWSWWQQVVGASYPLAAVVLLLGSAGLLPVSRLTGLGRLRAVRAGNGRGRPGSIGRTTATGRIATTVPTAVTGPTEPTRSTASFPARTATAHCPHCRSTRTTRCCLSTTRNDSTLSRETSSATTVTSASRGSS